MGTKNILALLTVFLFGILLATLSYIHAGENISIGEQSKPTEGTKLRILTINVWCGLYYAGILRMREYETREKREARFKLLIKQVKEIQPDIIFIQEANPVAKYSRKLARELRFDKIHQVCEAGIKLGPVGLPVNLKKGNAILTRPGLHLKKYENWKLSGVFGIFGDIFTIHFSDATFALVGKIVIHDAPIYLVNVHLSSLPVMDDVL